LSQDFGPGISMPPRPSWALGMLLPLLVFLSSAWFPLASLQGQLRTWQDAPGKAHSLVCARSGGRCQGQLGGQFCDYEIILSITLTFMLEKNKNKWSWKEGKGRMKGGALFSGTEGTRYQPSTGRGPEWNPSVPGGMLHTYCYTGTGNTVSVCRS
jgi:hypothetical protein